MSNSTITSVERFQKSSAILYYEEGHGNQISEEEPSQMTVLEAGYLFSIELNREKIRSELGGVFSFAHANKELDFISNHSDILALLPSIGEYLLKEFSNSAGLCLELMEEENNWKILFIKVLLPENADWRKASETMDLFYDNMFDLYPSAMEKLNIEFTTNAI